MASLKIRNKSRFNQSAGGSIWADAWKYGSKPRVRGGRSKRRKISQIRNAVREADAMRQYMDNGIDWNEVKEWLDEGLTLEDAKLYARTEV